jgi:hypothetical protein
MLLNEIDKRLDTECKIVFGKDDRVFTLSKVAGDSFQAFLESKGNERVLSVYVPKENLESGTSPVKFLTSTTENEGFIIANVPIEDSIYEFLTSLDEVESTSSLDMTVEKGRLTVWFRLHHTALSHLSRVFSKSSNLKHMVTEMNIQPSIGFITRLESKSKKFPLCVLEYSAPYSVIKGKVAKSLFDKGAIAESTAILSSSTNRKTMFYGERNWKTEAKPISNDSGLYEISMEGMGAEILTILTNVFNSVGLKRFNVFFKKNGNNLKIIVFVQKYDAMRHISESFTYYTRADIPVYLTLSRDYSDEIWGTL